jgi:hypothetical protein
MTQRVTWGVVALLMTTCAAPVAGAQTQAQNPPPTQTPPQVANRLRVFLECGACFETYLRDEIEWVDFLRDPNGADVHIIGTSATTGGGGREVALRFVGLGRFQDVDTDLKAVSQGGDSDDMRRQGIRRVITVGLLTYLERAGRGGDVRIRVDPLIAGGGQTTVADDPWKAWVFTVEGGASLDFEESSRQWEWSARATADRVTEKWNLSFAIDAETSHEEFDLDEDEPLSAIRRSREVESFVSRALGPHWSLGFAGEASSSSFGNQSFLMVLTPAIEYNLFPYADYASRQLRFTYAAGVEHAKYYEVTLFDKVKETNPKHQFEITLDQVQPWGQLQVNMEFGQYLQDLSKYRIELGGELSYRITRGLSLELDGSITRLRDQLSLPKRDATDEEVLLRLRELQSNYNADFSVSLTYRFGSLFNNIVNPRFGRD